MIEFELTQELNPPRLRAKTTRDGDVIFDEKTDSMAEYSNKNAFAHEALRAISERLKTCAQSKAQEEQHERQLT